MSLTSYHGFCLELRFGDQSHTEALPAHPLLLTKGVQSTFEDITQARVKEGERLLTGLDLCQGWTLSLVEAQTGRSITDEILAEQVIHHGAIAIHVLAARDVLESSLVANLIKQTGSAWEQALCCTTQDELAALLNSLRTNKRKTKGKIHRDNLWVVVEEGAKNALKSNAKRHICQPYKQSTTRLTNIANSATISITVIKKPPKGRCFISYE